MPPNFDSVSDALGPRELGLCLSSCAKSATVRSLQSEVFMGHLLQLGQLLAPAFDKAIRAEVSLAPINKPEGV